MTASRIVKLEGRVQHYAWGGYRFIPSWMGIENTENKPYAEYWLGTHPLAPAVVRNGSDQSLADLISSDPQGILSAPVAEAFGGLPYLLKLQDVREVLSIQVHPNKEEAEKGFEREEAAGIPRDAAHRNYKDRNHKPEVAVAVSEFWLLHGFREMASMEQVLSAHPSLAPLLQKLREEGLQPLYSHVMQMPQAEVDQMLLPVVRQAIHDTQAGYATRNDPAFWVSRYFNGEMPEGPIDRGIFSVYLLNIVKLEPGESIFQAAGILHAYLEGYNVELMANSDNVLRGGLTPKHVDVPELLRLTHFKPVKPKIDRGFTQGPETVYPCPVGDFGISRIVLEKGQEYSSTASSLEIQVLLSGAVHVSAGDISFESTPGLAHAVVAGTPYTLRALRDAVLYRAFVPAQP